MYALLYGVLEVTLKIKLNNELSISNIKKGNKDFKWKN